MDHFLVVPGRKGKTPGVMSLFRDRVDAGRHLADVLLAHAGLGGGEVVVLGLPAVGSLSLPWPGVRSVHRSMSFS
jgi:predicted phosphoribosyltransferase